MVSARKRSGSSSKTTNRDSQATSRVGIHAVAHLVEGGLKWAFREQLENDYGIDAQVEPKSTQEGPSGRLIALQIKAGSHYFEEQTTHGVIYRGLRKHLDYWERHCLPVILVLHEPSAGRTIWQVVTKDTVRSTKKGWKITVPFRNVLSEGCSRSWLAISEGPPYQRRLRALVLAKPWMDLIRDGKRLLLDVEEWVNKSSGRGAMELLAQDPDSGQETVVEGWSAMFPGEIYQELLPHLFPWADIAIDEEFYDDYDQTAYDEECGVWDSEEGHYAFHTEDYGEWRERLPEIRPYEISAGEVARFRLELTISALGKCFLQLDDYLETGTVSVGQSQVVMDQAYGSGLKALARRYGFAAGNID